MGPADFKHFGNRPGRRHYVGVVLQWLSLCSYVPALTPTFTVAAGRCIKWHWLSYRGRGTKFLLCTSEVTRCDIRLREQVQRMPCQITFSSACELYEGTWRFKRSSKVTHARCSAGQDITSSHKRHKVLPRWIQQAVYQLMGFQA